MLHDDLQAPLFFHGITATKPLTTQAQNPSPMPTPLPEKVFQSIKSRDHRVDTNVQLQMINISHCLIGNETLNQPVTQAHIMNC